MNPSPFVCVQIRPPRRFRLRQNHPPQVRDRANEPRRRRHPGAGTAARITRVRRAGPRRRIHAPGARVIRRIHRVGNPPVLRVAHKPSKGGEKGEGRGVAAVAAAPEGQKVRRDPQRGPAAQGVLRRRPPASPASAHPGRAHGRRGPCPQTKVSVEPK